MNHPHIPKIVTVAPGTAEFPRNSEASVVELKDGSLMIVWQQFGASEHEGGDEGPSRIVSAFSSGGGVTWSDFEVAVAIEEGDVSVYSPSLLRLHDGSILFTYMRYHRLKERRALLSSYYACRSYDEGKSFTEPTVVWSHRNWGPASHALKQLRDGRIMVPFSRVTFDDQGDHSDNGVIFSDDGATWQECETWVDLPLRGAMEPAVEELSDGRILMIMRSQLGAIFQSLSADRGLTWSLPQTTWLRSPEACPELIRIPQTGDLLIIWNNSPYDPGFTSHYGKRTPLTVAVSRDDGASWVNIRDIENDPQWGYSNPACTITSDGTAVLTYWECPYLESGWMNLSRIGLRAALFPVSWLYS